MRGSGSERATAVRGSLFPPFSPLFPFFLFSSMAKIGPISAIPKKHRFLFHTKIGLIFVPYQNWVMLCDGQTIL